MAMNEQLTIEDHKIKEAAHLGSPNCSERPDPEDVSLIVIHCISLPPGQFGGEAISQLFLNQLDCQAHPYFATLEGLKVSAHLLIRRDGRLIQYVPFNKRAWHAGVSCYHGRARCNDFSIGIELEGTEESAYTEAQYRMLIAVLKTVHRHYPKTADHGLVGHSDIAPSRKSDPGPSFDWSRLAKAGFPRSDHFLEAE